jgi:hypothetical protein
MMSGSKATRGDGSDKAELTRKASEQHRKKETVAVHHHEGRLGKTDSFRRYGRPSASRRADTTLPDFDLGSTTAETRLKAKVIAGNDPYDTTGATKVTDEVVTVKQLLGPLAQEDVPILRCVGLNYTKHSM